MRYLGRMKAKKYSIDEHEGIDN